MSDHDGHTINIPTVSMTGMLRGYADLAAKGAVRIGPTLLREAADTIDEAVALLREWVGWPTDPDGLYDRSRAFLASMNTATEGDA